MQEQDTEEKRALQKLLREYDSNKGMAAFVCGRPVELMPAAEQERIIAGFCTHENISILAASKQKLIFARNLPLTPQEEEKLDEAIPLLEKAIEAFGAYMSGSLSLGDLRERVMNAVQKPLPRSAEEAADMFPRTVETLQFLSEEPLASKDSWDQMIDCSQMHDALTRASKLLSVIEGQESPFSSETVSRLQEIVSEHLAFYEDYFREKKDADEVALRFSSLSKELSGLVPVS